MSRPAPRTYIATLIAARRARPLAGHAVTRARNALKAAGAGVGRARWLDPGIAFALPFEDIAPRAGEDALVAAFAGSAVDVIAGTERPRPPRLLVADMDATIVAAESLDELAGEAGIRERIAGITERAMRGELDFAAAVRERVGLLAGLDAAAIARTLGRLRLTAGARTLVRTLAAFGARTVLVSGGFECFAEPIARRAGFDRFVANRLVVENGRLAGRVEEPILDRDTKRAVLMTEARGNGIRLSETVAIGDGANDLPMIRRAGFGIAFHAKPKVAAGADARIRHGDLRAVLYALGIPGRAFRG